MSIGIITYHKAINYGAILQSYALQHYLIDNYDENVEIINYISNKIKKDYNQSNNIKSLIKKMIVGKYEDTTRNKFDSFINENIFLSSEYDETNINKAGNIYDIYFTGSDQVWNYKGNGFDSNYFLEFVSNKNKRNSYAASIGMSEIPEEYREYYFNNLNSMNNISVREKSGKKIIEKCGIEKNIDVVLDPTLLLKRIDWEKLVEGKDVINIAQEYILIYSFSLSSSLYDFAIKLSKSKGMPVYCITNSPKKWKGIKNIRGVGPLDFVSLFNHASYVLTNSFHGTAFAINFNKIFWVDLSTSLNKAVTSRITDILDELSISNRCVLDTKKDEIDYNDVNIKLDKMRIKSDEFIRKVCINESHK